MSLTRRNLLVVLNRSVLGLCGYLAARISWNFFDTPSAHTRSRRYLGTLADVEARAARAGYYIDDGGNTAVIARAGEVGALSLRCTHLGCTVRPSTDESELECPCHGSRFSFMEGRPGGVLQGPASEDLDAVEVARVRDDLFLES